MVGGVPLPCIYLVVLLATGIVVALWRYGLALESSSEVRPQELYATRLSLIVLLVLLPVLAITVVGAQILLDRTFSAGGVGGIVVVTLHAVRRRAAGHPTWLDAAATPKGILAIVAGVVAWIVLSIAVEPVAGASSALRILLGLLSLIPVLAVIMLLDDRARHMKQ